MLQLPHLELPATFQFDNTAYEAKAELHCSLLCTKNLAEKFQDSTAANDKLVAFVKSYVQDHKITFEGFTSRSYVCQDGEVKSIVVGAKVTGVSGLFDSLRQQFKELKDLPQPVLHVTLYKYNHRYGIGIQNEAQLHELCRPIPFAILPKVIKEQV